MKELSIVFYSILLFAFSSAKNFMKKQSWMELTNESDCRIMTLWSGHDDNWDFYEDNFEPKEYRLHLHRRDPGKCEILHREWKDHGYRLVNKGGSYREDGDKKICCYPEKKIDEYKGYWCHPIGDFLEEKDGWNVYKHNDNGNIQFKVNPENETDCKFMNFESVQICPTPITCYWTNDWVEQISKYKQEDETKMCCMKDPYYKDEDHDDSYMGNF